MYYLAKNYNLSNVSYAGEVCGQYVKNNIFNSYYSNSLSSEILAEGM